MGKELTDSVMLRVMAEELKPRGMVVVLGWCVVYATAGLEGLDDVIKRGPGSPATRYRVVSDINRVRDRLRRDGYDVTDSIDPAEVLRLVGMPKGSVPV